MNRIMLASAALALAFSPHAPAPIYMQYEGVDGSVTAAGHERWIEVQSILLGMDNVVGTPATNHNPLTIIKPIDVSTPVFSLLTNQRMTANTATIEITRHTQRGEEAYMQYILENVIITSYQTGPRETQDLPMESLSMNYSKITWTYIRRDGTGNILPPVTTSWVVGTAPTAVHGLALEGN